MEDVVLIPSLGRPASDFDLLSQSIRKSGYRAFAIDPRPEFPGQPNLHDLARDTVQQLDDLGLTNFHLVGHAFGNRLSRCITADYADRVLSLTLLAAWSKGIGSVINGQGIMQSSVVRENANIPEDQVIMTCVAMGYPDETFVANDVKSRRSPNDKVASFIGFE